MRRLPLRALLLLVLLAVPGTAFPSDAGPSAVPALTEGAAPEADPPLLVQAHQAFVRVQGQRVRGSITWTVAVLEPARAEGLPAPEALDGTSNQGARILQGRLDLPDGIQPGTVLTFRTDLDLPRTPFAPAGTFRTVPGHPVARAELVVRATGAPLTVWSDPRAIPAYEPGRTDEVRVVWRDVEPDEVAEAVWSTGEGWLQAGRQLDAFVDPLLTDDLPDALTQNLDAVTPTRAARRVAEAIRLVPGPDVGWIARPARRVLQDGEGTRAERGLVLLSLLRAAGWDVRPALYRPSDLPGTVPTAVAAPSLLLRPVLAVMRDQQIQWIDPGEDALERNELPPALTGAMAWVAGDLPRPLEATGAAEGTVSITGALNLDRGGDEQFTLTLTASGTAQEALRDALVGLDDAARADLLRPLMLDGRPALDRLTVKTVGLERRDKALQVTVSGHAEGRLDKVGSKLISGPMPPVLAPALAAWLPPRIAVREELAVSPPPGLRLFTRVEGPRPTHPAAVVARNVRLEADRVVIVTDVERPVRHPGPAEARRAAAALEEAARTGPEILYLQDATPRAARSARQIDRPAADRVVLEAMLWWRQARYRKGRKLLKKYLAPVGVEALDEALLRYEAPYELRRELVDLADSPADRLATVPILVDMDRRDEAWARAAAVSLSPVHRLRVDSRLWMVRLQGEAPPADDPEAAARWRDPEELLAEADASAKRAGDGSPDPRVLAARAERLLAAGRAEEARALLQKASSLQDDPALAVALAEAAARAGDPVDDVRASLQEAVARAPSDPEVLGAVAEALAAAGDRTGALERALGAARLSGRDPQSWTRVVDHALVAGELPIAVYAARRASDLALTDKKAADTLVRTAAMAWDQDVANLGWERQGDWLPDGETSVFTDWPPALFTLIGGVDQEHLLAILRHHDRAVVADPNLLSLRAQLELAQGDRARAIRDGLLLSELHDQARGGVVAFGAALGQAWSSEGNAPLDRLVRRDPAARATRLELAALTGLPIGRDLRGMSGDPRSELWGRALRDPAGLAAEATDWRAGPPPRGGAPRGFRENEVLGAVAGVAAWSDPVARLAVIRHAGSTRLPPPLSLLYTLQNPPLRSLPREGRVHALAGGPLPLFVASRKDGAEWVLGLGHSPEDATRALEAAPPL